MSSVSKGNGFELDVWGDLEDDGWVVGSRRKGRRRKDADGEQPGDLIAFKPGAYPVLVECKATKAGPYSSFGPADRDKLLSIAEGFGLQAVLAWKKPRQKKPVYISWRDWP